MHRLAGPSCNARKLDMHRILFVSVGVSAVTRVPNDWCLPLYPQWSPKMSCSILTSDPRNSPKPLYVHAWESGGYTVQMERNLLFLWAPCMVQTPSEET